MPRSLELVESCSSAPTGGPPKSVAGSPVQLMPAQRNLVQLGNFKDPTPRMIRQTMFDVADALSRAPYDAKNPDDLSSSRVVEIAAASKRQPKAKVFFDETDPNAEANKRQAEIDASRPKRALRERPPPTSS